MFSDEFPAPRLGGNRTPGYLHELLDSAALAGPDAAGIEDASGAWRWLDVAVHSRAWAAWLGLRGVGRGDRVVALLPNGRALAALVFAVSRLGAALAPVAPTTPRGQRRALVTDLGARVVVAAEDVDVASGGPADGTGPGDDAGVPRPASCGPVTVEDPVLLLYTSGSTATPKAVVCGHRQVLFATAAIHRRLGYRPDDRVLCALPLTFDYGLYQVFLAAMAGASVRLVDMAGEAAVLRSVSVDWGATVLPVVPALAGLVARLAGRRGPLPTVRLVTNTGEAMGGAVLAGLRTACPGAAVVLMFGLTECKRVTVLEPDGDRSRPGSVGRPLPGTEVRVVDEDLAPLGPGEVGEIVVRGPHVMSGYWRAPELTARRFVRSPDTGEVELRTGDRGWLDADGYLYFAGRTDGQFKLHGVRTSCAEVEAAASSVPGVRAVCVCPPERHEPAVLVVAGDLDGAQLAAAMRDRIDVRKVPTRCLVVDSLPLTVNQKVDRPAVARLARGCPQPASRPGPSVPDGR